MFPLLRGVVSEARTRRHTGVESFECAPINLVEGEEEVILRRRHLPRRSTDGLFIGCPRSPLAALTFRAHFWSCCLREWGQYKKSIELMLSSTVPYS